MRILITGATQFEIAGIDRNISSTDHLITGIGSPATVYAVLKKLQQGKYDLVIQAGIAGSFTNTLEPGEIVFVEQDCFADLGISEQNSLFTLFEKGFADCNEFPFEDGFLKNKSSLPSNLNCKAVTGITVNTVTDNIFQINQLQAKYKPGIETMEGAALHYVCLLEKIPFLQVRAISNMVGERNKENWKIKEAIKNLDETVNKIIKLIP